MRVNRMRLLAPMVGAVLHSINTRLDADIIAFMLDHAETKVLIGDTEYAPVLKEALGKVKVKPFVDRRPMSKINETITALHDGKLSLRPVLWCTWRIFCSSAVACRAWKPTLRPSPQVSTA